MTTRPSTATTTRRAKAKGNDGWGRRRRAAAVAAPTAPVEVEPADDQHHQCEAPVVLTSDAKQG